MSNVSPAVVGCWTVDSPGRSHVCQIHQRESALIDAAVRYLLPGLSSNENIVIVTRRNRLNTILNWLAARGYDTDRLEKDNRLFARSTSDLLDGIFEDGLPDWDAFNELVTDLFDTASRGNTRRLRIYGDAVGDLWEASNHVGAIRLEEYWSEFQQRTSYNFSVFCGYLIDALSPDSYSEYLPLLTQTHHFTLTTSDSVALQCAIEGAIHKVLPLPLPNQIISESTVRAGTGLPEVFQRVMWLRETHPESVADILVKAKQLYGQAGLHR